MEPMLISESSRHYGALVDLTVDLTARSTQLKSALPPGVVDALARLVRAMNCYCSNLIEGHDTHPIDIERAMQNDYSDDPKKRDLQKEARAHIEVQTWIDEGGLKDINTPSGRVLEIHRRFGELLPEDLLKVENPDTGEVVKLEPGELRHRDVRVGRHVAVSPGALPRFMARFDQAYGRLGRANAIVAAATAHHRLLWMHPFLDGNSRVARLMSYAMLREALDTGGIWSIARGLARNEAEYKQHLMACDNPRRNDLDGRGNLSEEALASLLASSCALALIKWNSCKDLCSPINSGNGFSAGQKANAIYRIGRKHCLRQFCIEAKYPVLMWLKFFKRRIGTPAERLLHLLNEACSCLRVAARR